MEVAPRVGTLHCVDAAAEALEVARENLADQPNCRFHHASVEAIPIPDASMDFGYSLGVLHHIPDPAAGMRACASKLKPGAPFLVYLYYALDGRPAWFRALWRLSDAVRKIVMRLPFRLKVIASTVIAAVAYFPFARLALLAEKAGVDVHHFPLATYRDRSFYSMRTDALDRFGTQLEYRFTADGVRDVMTQAGLERIELSQSAPYWCAVGYRTAEQGNA
jgi:SAM-dependent methyltransferase